MIEDGIIERKDVEKGIKKKKWVKKQIDKGQKVVEEYIEEEGIKKDIEEIGLKIVGLG